MSTNAISPLRQRMIEDMNARKLGAHSQRSHISSCKRFAGFLASRTECYVRLDPLVIWRRGHKREVPVLEHQIRYDDGAGYERYMGSWSRLAGEVFLDWLAPRPGFLRTGSMPLSWRW